MDSAARSEADMLLETYERVLEKAEKVAFDKSVEQGV